MRHKPNHIAGKLGLHNVVNASFAKTKAAAPKYAATLVGPRTRGSTTEVALIDPSGLVAIPDRCPIRTYPGAKGATVYEYIAEDLLGRLGAVAYETIHEIDRARVVHVRDGEHGPELVMLALPDPDPDGPDSALPTTWILSVIVGPKGDLWTWHPGGALEPFCTATGPQPKTAVKVLVNHKECDTCTRIIKARRGWRGERCDECLNA